MVIGHCAPIGEADTVIGFSTAKLWTVGGSRLGRRLHEAAIEARQVGFQAFVRLSQRPGLRPAQLLD
jgi:hypothetical protein